MITVKLCSPALIHMHSHSPHYTPGVCKTRDTRLIASVVTQTQLPQPEHIKHAVNTGKAELASAILGKDQLEIFKGS